MTLSEHIKQKRKKNGLSQVELAERAGVGLNHQEILIGTHAWCSTLLGAGVVLMDDW